MNKNEYPIRCSEKPQKRVCLTLDLRDDQELIKQYKYYHSSEVHWAEINEGIKDAGIQLMDIYLVNNRLFMICEIDANADFDRIWEKIGTYPRQDEWQKLMNRFIQAIPNHPLEWVKMERVFSLR